MSLSLQIKPVFTAEYIRVKGYGTASFTIADKHPVFATLSFVLTDGTGSGQVDLLYVTSPTSPPSLAASATSDLDLNGVTPDAIGDTVSFAKVKVIALYADPTNVNDVVLGGAASNVFQGPFNATTHKVNIRPGGWANFIAPQAGWTVTPGTGDLLRIANGAGGTAVIYHLLIAGTSV